MQRGRRCPIQRAAARAYASGVGMIIHDKRPSRVTMFVVIFVSTKSGAYTTQKAY
jgi:hypothetical protein